MVARKNPLANKHFTAATFVIRTESNDSLGDPLPQEHVVLIGVDKRWSHIFLQDLMVKTPEGIRAVKQLR